MDGNYFGKIEPWVRHTTSTKEFELSNDPAISSFEDLQESPFGTDGNTNDSEEVFEIRGQFGMPRPVLGLLIVRRALNGKLYTRMEE